MAKAAGSAYVTAGLALLPKVDTFEQDLRKAADVEKGCLTDIVEKGKSQGLTLHGVV